VKCQFPDWPSISDTVDRIVMFAMVVITCQSVVEVLCILSVMVMCLVVVYT